MSAIHWRSSKIPTIPRVCRSPAAAKTQVSLDGEDDLLYLGVLWIDMTGGQLDPLNPNMAAQQVAAMVTNSKNSIDKLHQPTVCISLKDLEKAWH